LGWFTGKIKNTEKIVFHTGDGDGTHSAVFLMPERELGIALIGNSVEFNEPMTFFALEVLEIMLETKFGIKLPDDSSYTKIDIDSSLLANYVGKYIMEDDIIEVYLTRTNKLKVKAMGFNLDLIPISNTQFRVKHWLLDVGRFDIEFFSGNAIEDKFLLASIENVTKFYGPCYPEELNHSLLDQNIFGAYDCYPSNSSVYYTGGTLGSFEFRIEDGFLKLGDRFLLKPISETQFIIINGAFVGETMTYDENTRSIYWSSYVYTKVDA